MHCAAGVAILLLWGDRTVPDLKYPCPICGYYSFNEPPGSYGGCRFCGWEDDSTQLLYPMWATGANEISLYEYQQCWLAGKDAHFAGCHSDDRPTETDVQDPGWRPFDPARDKFLVHDDSNDEWQSSQLEISNQGLYWWRDDYWLRPSD